MDQFRNLTRWILPVVVLANGLPGLLTAQSQRQAAQPLLTAMASVASILETAKDGPTAQAAKPKLEAAVNALEQAAKAFEGARPTRGKGGDKAGNRKIMQDLDAAQTKLGAALTAVRANPAAKQELGVVLETLAKQMR